MSSYNNCGIAFTELPIPILKLIQKIQYQLRLDLHGLVTLLRRLEVFLSRARRFGCCVCWYWDSLVEESFGFRRQSGHAYAA